MIVEIDQHEWHPRLKSLYAYWRSKHPADGLPRKRDIDPVEIGPLLNNVFLLSVERDPLRFRYRLLGSAIATVSRANVTGRYMDEVYPDAHEKPSYSDYIACTRDAAVRYYRGNTMFDPHFNFLSTDRLLLPVTEETGSVDFILGGAVYRDAAGAEI
jgi:hypothetical protein